MKISGRRRQTFLLEEGFLVVNVEKVLSNSMSADCSAMDNLNGATISLVRE